ncbi:MAG: mechanosensitive ion channel domain-containing protein [Candidatus Thorarchaeota archaeon]
MLQTTSPDFFVDPILFLQFHWDNIFPYVLVLVYLIILIIIYMIATALARRSLKSIGMGIEAASGVVLILRLIFFIVAVTILVSAFEASLATILSLGAIFGTALGLAFSQALGNIVSGLYVVAARPFRVGDYVRIGTVEGIVKEITLNYTRVLLADETHQLVPNNKVVGSQVTNYRIEDLPGLIEDKEEERDEAVVERRSRRYVRSMDSAMNKLKDLATDEDYYRYTFDLTLHMSFNHSKMMKHFDKVCIKWATIFLAQPTYLVWAKASAALTYRFTIIVQDPMMIINRNSEFMEDLLEKWIEMDGK